MALAFSTTSGIGQEQEKVAYVCVDDQATGFDFDKGPPHQTNYNPGKFTLVMDWPKLKLKSSIDEIKYTCSKPFIAVSPDKLQCIEAFQFLTINLVTLKYYRARMYGEIGTTEAIPSDPPDSVVLARGTCQKF